MASFLVNSGLAGSRLLLLVAYQTPIYRGAMAAGFGGQVLYVQGKEAQKRPVQIPSYCSKQPFALSY